MTTLAFHLLKKYNCVVKFGYLAPKDIADNNPVDGRKNLHKEDRARLAESIAEEGVRNPLICSSYEGRDTYVTVGHHRLWAAKKAKIKQIPVIVNDFCNRYPDFEILTSLEETREKFKDQPNIVRTFRSGVSTSEPLVGGDTWWTDSKKKS